MVYLTRKGISRGGKDSWIEVHNSDLNIAANVPVEMGGTKTGGTNPEELFLAGAIGCLTRSFEFLARQKGLKYNSVSVAGEVSLEDDELKGGFEFSLFINFVIDGMDDELKKEMVEQTVAFCPFSKAIKGNVSVDYIIE